ncbi:MAG: hypothetical protein IKM88_15845, partial [Lachnospiraceae bacterium]|nr:hypothetical protein [Lachnospiraceae bacterium]
MELESLCRSAKAAKYEMQRYTTAQKNDALLKIADLLVANGEEIIAANAKDLENAQVKGMSVALQDRLRLTAARIEGMSEGLKQVAALPDPIGEVLETFDRPNGLKLAKVRVALVVIGIIYESRPNVTADAFALTFKSGNVVILKGGSDAIHSNMAITKVIRSGLKECGITEDAMGCPILSSMEVVQISTLPDGTPVYCDENAAAADGIVILNKV